MKLGFYSIIAGLMGMSIHSNPYHKKGTRNVDDSSETKKLVAKRRRKNIEKPWKGMKWFAKYGVWAINERNAKRKSLSE